MRELRRTARCSPGTLRSSLYTVARKCEVARECQEAKPVPAETREEEPHDLQEFDDLILRQHLAPLDLLRPPEYNPSMELAGKVVVVTGASMGIGEAIAKVFVESGANVVLLSRDATRAEAARVRIGFAEHTAAFSCDVRHSEEIDRVLALTLHHFQRIDVWINNAGHGLRDSVSQMDMSSFHDMFETNFFGAVSATQKVIPVMRQQGGGTIINISSVAGHIPLPFNAGYSATKFALNAIGKGTGVELKKDGIHVLTVCPGYVATAFSANAVRGNELKKVRPNSVRGISAERVARATLQGYLKGKREVIVPWTMHIPVKLYQLFPGLVEWAMGRMAK
jgi:short-subunit dehydrogenase